MHYALQHSSSPSQSCSLSFWTRVITTGVLCSGMPWGSRNVCNPALSSRVLCTRILTVKLAILLWCRGFLQAPTRQMALSAHSHSPLHCNWEEVQANFQLSLLSNFTAVCLKLKHPLLVVLCIFIVTSNLLSTVLHSAFHWASDARKNMWHQVNEDECFRL